MARTPSGSQPISVPRIERCFPDILQSENLCRQPFQPDRESAVRRHSQFKHFEVAFKLHRVDPSPDDRSSEIHSPMQSLTASRDLHPSKQ